jgi:hypothetical protein
MLVGKMNATIFTTSFGNCVVEWNRDAYDCVLAQLRTERQQSQGARAFEDSIDVLFTALSNSTSLAAESFDTETLTLRATRLVSVLFESVNAILRGSTNKIDAQLQAQPDISHANDSA